MKKISQFQFALFNKGNQTVTVTENSNCNVRQIQMSLFNFGKQKVVQESYPSLLNSSAQENFDYCMKIIEKKGGDIVEKSMAMFYVGLCYYSGNVTEIDLDKSLYWLKKATENGNNAIKQFVGLILTGYYWIGNVNIEKADREYGISLLRAIAQNGDATMQYIVASILLFEDYEANCDIHILEIGDLILKSANGACKLAQLAIADFYANGVIFDKNIQYAVSWYEKALADDDMDFADSELIADAQATLAQIYYDELCNIEKALYWATKAADLDSQEAKMLLLRYYAKIEPNGTKFTTLLLDAAINDAQLAYDVGMRYCDGTDNFSRNFSEARKWFARAIELGHRQAEWALDMIANKK